MQPTMIDPNVPLVDLHRHLEGNMRLETVWELAQQHGLPLPAADLAGLRHHLQVESPQPGLMAFIAKMDGRMAALADLDACRRVAYENVVDARREGLDYLELRFSPLYMARPHGLNPAGVVEAVVDGALSAGRELGLPVSLIGILSRTFGLEACAQEFAALRSCPAQITALDIAGDEAAWPAELFAAHFRAARDLGWHITAHAGEAAGPESIWSALRDLGAERIGHGLRAIEDPALVDYLIEHEIGLEVSLTSNVQIGAVASYAAHPLKAYVERGVWIALSSDDPAVSGIDLRHEYDVAAPAAGLSREQIAQVQRTAVKMAFAFG